MKVFIDYRSWRNPEWTYGSEAPFYITKTIEVEVLTVHFEKGTMRVRFLDVEGRKKTVDVDAAPFFEKYQVIEK